LTTSQRIFAVVLLLTACPYVRAADELTLHLGVRVGNEIESEGIELESLEPRLAVGLTYSHRLRPQGWLWTSWSLQATELYAPGLLPDRNTIDLDIHHLHVGTSYRPEGSGRARGFVMFGLGLIWVDPPDEFDAELGSSLLVGGGVRTPISSSVTFRFDARVYMTLTDTTLSGRCGGVGCQIDFAGGGAFQLELLAGLTFDF
jgi:hypothetical protein